MRRPRERHDGARPQDLRAEVSHPAVRLLAKALRDGDDQHLLRDESLEALDDGREILGWRREHHDLRARHGLRPIGLEVQVVRERHALQELLVPPRLPHLLDIFGKRTPQGHVMPVPGEQHRVRRSPSAVSDDRNPHIRCPIFSFLVSRYRRSCAVGGMTTGTRSVISSPYPSSPAILHGLFVISRSLRMPRSTRICAPSP